MSPKALAVIGDGAHQFDDLQLALAETLGDESNLDITFSDDVADLCIEKLVRYDLLITARGASRGITGQTGADVRRFIEEGRAALFLHNSSHLCYFGGIPDLRDAVGGSFIEHSEGKSYRVEVSSADHPIVRGVQDFVVTGEQHFVVYDRDPAHVFLRNRDLNDRSYKNLGSTCEAGWAFGLGQGRVCFLSPGHTGDVYRHPEYRKLQRNALDWLLKRG